MNTDIFENEIINNWARLRKLVQYILKNDSLTDDVLQDAYIKAITTSSLPKSKSKVLPWFKTILKHTALDILRKQKRESKLFLEKSIEISIKDENVASSVCTCVKQLISELSSSDRDLLMELEINGHSLNEIAVKMGIKKETLKVRRHRARARLKKVLISVCNFNSDKECEHCECS
jgi:RNA polymerase sigma factor (sigma-70 family)